MGTSSSRRLVGRLARAPLRALARFCDLYVRALTSCAAHAPYGAAMAYPAVIAPLPPSYRQDGDGGGGDDDLKELIRVASARVAPQTAEEAVRKSRSLAIWRIDEEEPCDFGSGDGGAQGPGLLLPRRSRSCAGEGKLRRPVCLCD